jgi:hypothetical protein
MTVQMRHSVVSKDYLDTLGLVAIYGDRVTQTPPEYCETIPAVLLPQNKQEGPGVIVVTVEAVPRWQRWMASWMNQPARSKVTELQIEVPHFGDDQLLDLCKLRTLRHVELYGSEVTDAAIARFCDRSKVRSILLGSGNTLLTEKSYKLALALTSKHNYQMKGHRHHVATSDTERSSNLSKASLIPIVPRVN